MHLKIKTKYSASHAQEHHSVNKSHCGRPSKLTYALNETIRVGVRDKKSLEVILQDLTGVCLRTLYHWVDKGWLDVKYHAL
ncbi:IS30 family transposase [Lactovum miscens]|uniref:IS30 family transposase n=1 Tax=Lactovum miscens TaxID=190387 RepID=A0A841C8T9_9LACT|nr:hypothetical protein [Lactovum miscens]MBB5887640.1 IS30 family transposase [Lactovum miscens]